MNKRILTPLLLLFALASGMAQTGTWRNYMAYNEPQQIVRAGETLFVMASNDLYSYNLQDESITTFDKLNGLSDNSISNIRWNPATQQLLIIYANQNIDLMDLDGNVVNVSALYHKSMMGDKTVNAVFIDDANALLATGFGVVKLNMARAEVAESYVINKNVTAVGATQDAIYLRVIDDGNATCLMGLKADNLIDPHNWQAVAAASLPSGIFNTDLTDYNTYIDLVKTLKPGGPKYNFFGHLAVRHSRLYTSGFGYTPGNEMLRPGTIQILKDGEWIFPQDDFGDKIEWKYIDVDVVEPTPEDPDHLFAGARSGLYEFQDGELVECHNVANSPLQTAVSGVGTNYVLVEGLTIDDDKTVWVFNSSTRSQDNIFAYHYATHEWENLQTPRLTNNGKSLKGMQSVIRDSRGYIWFVNNNWEYPAIFCYDPQRRTLVHEFLELKNQDGIVTRDFSPYLIREDREGNLWIGTNVGLYLIEASQVGQSDPEMMQVKVPRNDGSNYADYLFGDLPITSIAVDGGGRKWFGSQGQGIYLIASDNITQVEHFTAEETPLLSNNIEALAIDNATGQLFIGTDAGLCSYMTDATEPSESMETDNVYAYPNPVVRDYNGLITVVGLSFNSDVKILSADGRLIAQGRSNGGTFTWNGLDGKGRRVASGIYMVAAATQEGRKGVVCKIAVVN